uniref:Uncharacterized protein n=1 Tax=Glossina pallidipes TaxID=7398 RepID=A0A1B0AJ81_GLOPL
MLEDVTTITITSIYCVAIGAAKENTLYIANEPHNILGWDNRMIVCILLGSAPARHQKLQLLEVNYIVAVTLAYLIFVDQTIWFIGSPIAVSSAEAFGLEDVVDDILAYL